MEKQKLCGISKTQKRPFLVCLTEAVLAPAALFESQENRRAS